ncbi:RNA polymerase sigma factor [Paenibacillus sp. CN-4]|uniref:RNA polymerase sigma factor n=1 Tax=Paenibacillus nanchangensis TaxID=3348343 RepID=UPI00397E5925
MDEETEYRIRQVQAGDIQAYDYIVKKHQRQIFVYCWRLLGSEQEAEDAVQDILVHAFERIRQYKPTVSFSAWLYKMAYHHCLNLIRRRQLQRKFSLLLPRGQTAESPDETMERRLFSEPLSRALDRLTAEERNLLVLRVFEEKSFEEIGQITGRSQEAAKKKYARTKTKLKTVMEEIKEEHKPCVSYNTTAKNKA